MLGLIQATANGSRRGYNANKRSQAAQIAAQNGMQFVGLLRIVLFTLCAQRNFKHIRLEVRTPTMAGHQLQIVGAQADPVMVISNLDHAGAARSGTENSAGSGGNEGTGPLHPELQFARCMSNRYKTESFPRCVSCTRRWAGDTCRFQGIRFFLKDEKQNIVGVSFVENQKADSPSMKFPTRWNRPLDTVFIKEIKVRIALVSHAGVGLIDFLYSSPLRGRCFRRSKRSKNISANQKSYEDRAIAMCVRPAVWHWSCFICHDHLIGYLI